MLVVRRYKINGEKRLSIAIGPILAEYYVKDDKYWCIDPDDTVDRLFNELTSMLREYNPAAFDELDEYAELTSYKVSRYYIRLDFGDVHAWLKMKSGATSLYFTNGTKPPHMPNII
jgi:hypothetical protein